MIYRVKKWKRRIVESPIVSTIVQRKKRQFLFEYQNLLIKLTVLLVIALFFVLRGSTAPLIIDVEPLRFLLVTDADADKTLYNIGISYIAAYIFFIIQVYIPERRMCRARLNLILEKHYQLVVYLNEYLTAMNEFLKVKDGYVYYGFRAFSYTVKASSSLEEITNDIWSVELFNYDVEKIEPIFTDIIKNTPSFELHDYAYVKMMMIDGNNAIYAIRKLKGIVGQLEDNGSYHVVCKERDMRIESNLEFIRIFYFKMKNALRKSGLFDIADLEKHTISYDVEPSEVQKDFFDLLK